MPGAAEALESNVARAASARAVAPSPALVVAAIVAAALSLSPIALTLYQAAQVSAADIVDLLFRPLVGELVLNTILLIVAASATTAVVGGAAAWLVERTDLPGRKLWAVLAAAPLAIPPFISSFAWLSISRHMENFGGALLVVTCAYYPLVYLPVAAALRGLDPALEETARSLGEGAWGCFFRVVLPQLRPALYGGVLLVALESLNEFGAFALLQFHTFTTEIFAQFRAGFDGPPLSLLATVLLALCISCLIGETRARGRARYARVGAGARRRAAPVRLGRMRWPALIGFAALTLLTIGAPLGTIGFWLTQHASTATAHAPPSLARLIGATLSSAGLGLAGAAAAVLLAAPLGYLATRHPSWGAVLLERIAFLARGVPGIIVGMAFISLAIDYLMPLYQSAILLVVAYAILFAPFALVGVRAALEQVPPKLEEAARALGVGGVAMAVRVLAPLAAPGLGAGATLVFVFVTRDLTTTLLLAPIGTRTLATEVWANACGQAFAAAAPFEAILLALSLLSAWLLAGRGVADGLPERV